MKCQNCGKNEANFHYMSNINGNVTEQHLCSECAEKLNYNKSFAYSSGRMFNDMLSDFFDRPFRMLSPWSGFGFAMPTFFGSTALPEETFKTEESCKTEEKPAEQAEVDPEMQKRREINELREKMRAAAEAEDFEKAAEYRDSIREMEKNSDGPTA